MSRAERVFTVVVALSCLGGLACGDDDAAPEGSGGGGGEQDIEKVAMALTGGVEFENGTVVAALLPDPSNETVELDQSSTTLSLAPGDPEILPLEVSNADSADTQVEAVLLQFEGADEHVEVSVEGSEDENETFELPFTVDPNICDALCNENVRLKLMQAVRMTDGSISEHLERLLELDCTEDGDPDQCEGDEPMDEPMDEPEPEDGGTGGGGSSGGGAQLADQFASAVLAANTGLCNSCPELGGAPCDAILPVDEIQCMKDAIAAANDTTSVTAVGGLTNLFRGLMAECSACDMVSCPTSVLADNLSLLPTELADELLTCAGGTLPPDPPASM